MCNEIHFMIMSLYFNRRLWIVAFKPSDQVLDWVHRLLGANLNNSLQQNTHHFTLHIILTLLPRWKANVLAICWEKQLNFLLCKSFIQTALHAIRQFADAELSPQTRRMLSFGHFQISWAN